MKTNTCCFFGHREIKESEELKNKLLESVEKLIVHKSIDVFLFGSKSKFNSLCLEAVTKLKNKHPHIKRVYVRAEYPEITDDYKNYLLQMYDETYYPERVIGAGKAVYIKRNCEMIDKSGVCIIYYDTAYTQHTCNNGTKTAFDYAVKKGKEVINLCD